MSRKRTFHYFMSTGVTEKSLDVVSSTLRGEGRGWYKGPFSSIARPLLTGSCLSLQVERETGQSMQTLVELDTVKRRMMASQRALKEADNWTTLLADVEEVFATHDVDKVRHWSQISTKVGEGGWTHTQVLYHVITFILLYSNVLLRLLLFLLLLLTRLLRNFQGCSRAW